MDIPNWDYPIVTYHKIIMTKIIFPILLIFLFSCSQKQVEDNKEKIIFNRIEYIYKLKGLINENVWNGFSDEKFDLPLVYYTDSVCYISNPTAKILNIFQPELIFNSGLIKVYKANLIDSLPFHMETSIDFSNDTTYYNYQSPVMNCSSVEITNQTIPDITSTELWSTMILHEYFHGFQFKHLRYQTHIKNIISNFSQDSLKNIYKSNIWFQESVDEENKFLLNAISSNDSEEIIQLIDSVLNTRNERRKEVLSKLNIDITEVENIYETMEGSARYVEYSLYNMFSKIETSQNLVKADTSFHNYAYFKNFKIEKEEWLYLTEKTTYYYATGFNFIRLFDKLNIEYKTRLFQEEELTLENILKEYKNKR